MMSGSSKEDLAVLERLRNRLKTDNLAVQRILVGAGIMTKTGRLTSHYSGKRRSPASTWEADKRLPYTTVRGVFFEGGELYPGAGFREHNHIQVCVRDQESILGFFLPG